MTTVLALCLVACGGSRATRENCTQILGRIVDIELSERGFSDPALRQIKQDALARKFDQALDACVGRRLKAGAMSCVASAKNTEALTHDCLSD